jgi:superfamily II DNA or RNA helicase
MLLIKRSRIIAGARNKLRVLEELMEDYKHDNNILVYCGATKVFADREDDYDEDDARQIERVVDILGNKLNMRVSMFTSKEDAQERERIKDSFAEGHLLQALVAIKCLDEGVNIPGIRTAFIMASSTNPKEYVQRRGRVLRRAKGKQFAVIYDFITLHRSLDSTEKIGNVDCEVALFKREKERLDDFVRLCENPSESYKLVDKINEYYQLNFIGGHDYGI